MKFLLSILMLFSCQAGFSEDGDWTSDGVTDDELAAVCYAESASVRAKTETPYPGSGTNQPPAAKGQPGYKSPKEIARKDMILRMKCRLHRNKNIGTAPPSEEYDPGSSNPGEAEQSRQCKQAVDDANKEWDKMTDAEKDKLCKTKTHFWHECYRFDAQGNATVPPGTKELDQWVKDLKAGEKDKNYVCGYPKTKRKQSSGADEWVDTWFWDSGRECWMIFCNNITEVKL